MGYDAIISGPEDMLRLQITEDATAAREASAANGTNVFQAVRKLQATVNAVQQVVLDQRLTFDELVARFSASELGEDRNHLVPGGGQTTSYSYEFTLPGPEVERYALLSYSMRLARTSATIMGAYTSMSALSGPVYQSQFKQFPNPQLGGADAGFGATVPVRVPPNGDLEVTIDYSITSAAGSALSAQVRDVVCSITYGAPVE